MDRCEHCGEEHGATDVFCPKTGKLRAERLLPPHSLLEEKYLIGKPLGVGGMGAVFSATHTLLDKRVAIKVMLTSDEHAMARLVREARAASATGHPNITAVTDMGRTPQGSLFIVMEYLNGVDLDDLIKRRPLGPRRALRLIAQVLEGLDVVHRKGIIHRDLKPENLMVVRDDEGEEIVKILDFGISKSIAEGSGKKHLTDTGLVMGTPLYMSPEQARGAETIGIATDIYSAGAILYAMVCGRPPHVADTLAGLIAAKLENTPRPPSERDENLPIALDEIVLRALERAPEDRFASASAMRDAVLALLDDEERLATRAAPGDIDQFAALEKISSLDDGAALDHLELVTLDEASQGTNKAPPRAPKTNGKTKHAPPRAPRREGALDPIATHSDQAPPQRPSATAPREIELDSDAKASSLDLQPLDETATDIQEAAATAPPTTKSGRRVGGFPAEGAVVGIAYAGQARKRRFGPLRTLLWLLLLGGIGVGGYWFYVNNFGGFFTREVMIVIDTTPKGAVIEVDGLRLRRQPLVFRRSTRRVRVIIKAPGYQTAYTSFQPTQDVTMQINLVPLVDPKPAHAAHTPPHKKKRKKKYPHTKRPRRHKTKKNPLRRKPTRDQESKRPSRRPR